jgi:16S rRNA G966 N2-methylase RsmD
VLPDHIADELVDLIYLDPPFNSKRDYNLLFKTPKGMTGSGDKLVAIDAQTTAFEDAWHWAQQAGFEVIGIPQDFDSAKIWPSATNISSSSGRVRW